MHKFTLALGAVILIGGLLGIVFGHFPPGWVFACQGLFIVAAVLFERFRYKPLVGKPPAGNWVRTTERFVDDETGKPVTVWVDPATGARSYVAD